MENKVIISKEEALKAVRQNGGSLYYVSEELRNDKELVVLAIRENTEAFKYAGDELKNNKEKNKIKDLI